MSLDQLNKNIVLPGSVSAGAATYCGDMDITRMTLTIAGTFTATYQFEMSTDNSNFFSVGSAVVGAGAQKAQVQPFTDGTPAKAAMWVRARCTAFTSFTSGASQATGAPYKLV